MHRSNWIPLHIITTCQQEVDPKKNATGDLYLIHFETSPCYAVANDTAFNDSPSKNNGHFVLDTQIYPPTIQHGWKMALESIGKTNLLFRIFQRASSTGGPYLCAVICIRVSAPRSFSFQLWKTPTHSF